MKKHTIITPLLLMVIAIFVIGCGQANNFDVTDYDAMRSQLDEKEKEVTQLKAEIDQSKTKVNSLETEIKQKDATIKEIQVQNNTNPNTNISSPMLPANASKGECYARLYYPATYKAVVDTVVKAEASERVEITPATYIWVEEQVLVKEESIKLKDIPAKYEWVEDRILVQEAHTEWKKGRGLVEKADESTGEIMCLVEIPAKYRTVKRKILTQPASVDTIVIPAEYTTVKVKKIQNSSQEKRITIPAEYQTITRTVKVNDSHMEWKQVLCETNLNRATVVKIQSALAAHKHNPGPIDGIIGPLTHTAIKSYQKSNNLATGGLTHETIKSLGIQF
ncbi:MAG: hypothetical protein DWP97_01060 [Calditrichaeota bacterium]|nr:MAG: hypothetical protein DWP97_01060 [Calditrichota bacterium]